jgi:hypothetical protein
MSKSSYTGRWTEANIEQLPGMATEFVRLQVDLVLTMGAQAAKDATSTIPIAFIVPGDAEGIGLITSTARPGGMLSVYRYGRRVECQEARVLSRFEFRSPAGRSDNSLQEIQEGPELPTCA